MADGDHHTHKKLSLDEIQRLVGRAMIDETFRQEFVGDPSYVAGKLGIHVDDAARGLLNEVASVLKNGVDIGDAMDKIRAAYLASSDGVVRPRCG